MSSTSYPRPWLATTATFLNPIDKMILNFLNCTVFFLLGQAIYSEASVEDSSVELSSVELELDEVSLEDELELLELSVVI